MEQNADSVERWDATEPELAAERVRRFCAEYQTLRGNDPEVVYTVHVGTMPSPLTVTDLLTLVSAIEEQNDGSSQDQS